MADQLLDCCHPEHPGGPAFDTVVVPPPLPDGWRMVVAEGDMVDEAEHLEYDVFLEAGYTEPSDLRRALEYEPWRDSSRFHCVVSDAGVVEGTVRTIVAPYADVPAGKFTRSIQVPDDPVLEYASLAVTRAGRRQGLAEALYRAVFVDAVRHQVGGIVAITEDWLVQVILRSYDIPFIPTGPSRWYMGGECFPMGISLEHMVRHLSARQPSFFRWWVEELDLRELPGEVIDLTERADRTSGAGSVRP